MFRLMWCLTEALLSLVASHFYLSETGLMCLFQCLFCAVLYILIPPKGKYKHLGNKPHLILHLRVCGWG